MLNGLKALFTSGIIFRPMVFSGIIAGFLLSAFLDMEEAFPLFSDLSFICCRLPGLVFTLCFQSNI